MDTHLFMFSNHRGSSVWRSWAQGRQCRSFCYLLCISRKTASSFCACTTYRPVPLHSFLSPILLSTHMCFIHHPQSIHLSIHLSHYPPMRPSVHPPIHYCPFTCPLHPYICLSTDPSLMFIYHPSSLPWVTTPCLSIHKGGLLLPHAPLFSLLYG